MAESNTLIQLSKEAMILRAKQSRTLFNIIDDTGSEVTARWFVRLKEFRHELIEDRIYVIVQCSERSGGFIHEREFSLNANGASISKDQVATRFLNYFGDDYERI